MGGRFLPQLNTGGIPIAKKYREGKMKRPSKGVLKEPEIAEREAIESHSACTKVFISPKTS